MTSGMFLAKKNPIWVAKDGREFYSLEDFDNDHLMNMIPFVARDIFNMSVYITSLHDEDERALQQRWIDKRLSLSGDLLDEAKRRGLI